MDCLPDCGTAGHAKDCPNAPRTCDGCTHETHVAGECTGVAGGPQPPLQKLREKLGLHVIGGESGLVDILPPPRCQCLAGVPPVGGLRCRGGCGRPVYRYDFRGFCTECSAKSAIITEEAHKLVQEEKDAAIRERDQVLAELKKLREEPPAAIHVLGSAQGSINAALIEIDALNKANKLNTLLTITQDHDGNFQWKVWGGSLSIDRLLRYSEELRYGVARNLANPVKK